MERTKRTREYNAHPSCKIVDNTGQTCGQGHYAKGHCTTHYWRQLSGYTMDRPVTRRKRWKSKITYNTGHIRVRRVRGSAALQECVECGATAMHWALRRDAEMQSGPDPRSAKPRYWSSNPQEYQPMCACCTAEVTSHGRKSVHQHEANRKDENDGAAKNLDDMPCWNPASVSDPNLAGGWGWWGWCNAMTWCSSVRGAYLAADCRGDISTTLCC